MWCARAAANFASNSALNVACDKSSAQVELIFKICQQAASEAGRDASDLRLAVNRAALLQHGGLDEAAETLAGLRERGVDHAVVNLHPAEDVSTLLDSFASDYLGALQA